jgi:uncharacterized protein
MLRRRVVFPAPHMARVARLPVALLASGGLLLALGAFRSTGTRGSRAAAVGSKPLAATPLSAPNLRDSFADGFPDAVRLDRPADRAVFVHWLTFLAESEYYRPESASARGAEEISDCAGLIRFAYRNALAAHSVAWRQSPAIAELEGLPGAPDFGDLHKFTYPNWVLGANLFRVRPGPFVPQDLADGAFAQFADAAALLHLNTFFVSRDLRAAQPGDLLFYDQPGQREPYHSMLFVGRSDFQPQGTDWIVYHTGDLAVAPAFRPAHDGRGEVAARDGHGEVREVELRLLLRHPDPRWRPLISNPRFLGVYRFELLR